MSIRELLTDMQNCEQTKGMSVLQHGRSVHNYYKDLINHLRTGEPLKYEWKLPDWIYDHKDFILNNLESDEVMKRYMVLHDCSKPYVRTIDEDGKIHFPNHAEESYRVFKEVFPHAPEVISLMIFHDMDIHMMKAKDIDDFIVLPYCISLLVSGLCEVHSNATMFGGINHVNTKIKLKQIFKRGKQVLKRLQ